MPRRWWQGRHSIRMPCRRCRGSSTSRRPYSDPEDPALAARAGLAANLAMSNIYVETATEFVKTFRMLRYAVAEGGEYNMITGKERTMMMWALCDRMEELNRKLNVLCMSLWYYRLEDVWNYATRGLLDRDMSDVADESFRSWKRAYEISMMM